MNKTLGMTALCLALLLPMTAGATPGDLGISGEIRQELADARKEVRVEMAKARQELKTENLQLGDGNFNFGKDHDRDSSGSRPKAEITPAGDLLVDGKAQPIDAAQRKQLLAYRGLVIDIALAGIEVGQKSADAALAAVGDSWLGILFNAMTGQLENRVERVVREQVAPMVKTICGRLPEVMATQQRLAASLPAFRPYADLEPGDIEDCEDSIQNDFASR